MAIEHKDIILGHRHASHNYEVTAEAQLASIAVTTQDLGKLALDLVTGKYYRLKSVAPLVWEEPAITTATQQAIDAKVANDMTSSVSVAPSKSATIAALAVVSAEIVNASRPPKTIAFIGDSITANGVVYAAFPATPTGGWIQEMGSLAWATAAGTAEFEFRVADSNMRYKAPADSWGAWTPITRGINKLRSGTTTLDFLVGIKWDLLPVVDTATSVTLTATSSAGMYAVGYQGLAQTYSGHAFKLVSSHGIPGDSLAHISARLADVISYDTYMNDIAYTPNYLVVEGGTNDVVLYARTTAEITADIDDIVEAAHIAGITPILLTIAARTGMTTPEFTTMQEVNRYTQALAVGDSGVIVVDTFRATRDPAVLTGAPLANYLFDSAHPSNLGADVMGQAIAQKLVYLNRGEKGRSRCQVGGDPTNFLANNAFIGTAGTLGVGGGGVAPTNWTINRSGSALTVTGSIVPVANELPWLSLLMGGVAVAGDAAQAFVSAGLATSPSGIAAGEAAYADIEFDVSGATGLRRLDLAMYCYNPNYLTDGLGWTASYRYIQANKIFGAHSANSLDSAALTGVLRTPTDGVVIPAGTTNVKVYFTATFSAGGGGTVNIRAGGLFHG